MVAPLDALGDIGELGYASRNSHYLFMLTHTILTKYFLKNNACHKTYLYYLKDKTGKLYLRIVDTVIECLRYTTFIYSSYLYFLNIRTCEEDNKLYKSENINFSYSQEV